MKKAVLSSLIMILAGQVGFSQDAGYIGKRHEVSFEIFKFAYMNNLEFTYKYALTKNIALFLAFGKCDASRTMKSSDLPYIYDYNSIYGNISQPISGSINAQVTTLGFGVMSNSPTTNLQMPMGYYAGYGLHFAWGTIEDSYKFDDQNAAPPTNKIKYDMHDNSFRIAIGKNTAITPSLTLDIGFSYGISWGKLMADTTNALTESSPYSELPLPLPAFYKREFTSDGMGKSTYLRFYLMPHIRIGYLFKI